MFGAGGLLLSKIFRDEIFKFFLLVFGEDFPEHNITSLCFTKSSAQTQENGRAVYDTGPADWFQQQKCSADGGKCK